SHKACLIKKQREERERIAKEKEAEELEAERKKKECLKIENSLSKASTRSRRSRIDPSLKGFKVFCKTISSGEMQRIPEEFVSSLKMGDEHLNTQKDSREFSVKYPIPTPRELDVIPDEYYDEGYQKRFDELVKDFLSPTSIYDNISIGYLGTIEIKEIDTPITPDIPLREETPRYFRWFQWIMENFQNEFKNEKNSNSKTLAEVPIKDSLLMVDEQINTTPSTESDEIKKSSVEILNPIPRESKMKGLKRQKEAKTIKNRQRTKETRTRVKKQPEIKAGSARHSKKGSQRGELARSQSSFPHVILIGSISVEVPIAPEVGATVVASPAGVLELDTHSSSEVDPSESSPPPISVAPMVSPFLCSDDSESDTEIPDRHVSPTTSTPEIPTAPILPAPSAIVAPSSEFPLAPDIPIGRLYRTHPGGLCRALTMRKLVRPLSSHRLLLRYSSHNLDHFTSGSSSSHSSLDHSSSGHSISGHSLSGHTPPDTIDADSSTPLRFVHPSLSRTPRSSEAYLRWRSAPLSTMYPLTTSESSAGNSSSESSAGPSRKRCRSPTSTVTSPIHATRALVPSHADLLPPQKRFRDSISPEDSIEEDIDTDVLKDIKADVTVVEVAVDREVEA
ncbi:hypothetical protein Tco_1004934, partial [Tanacetum coccineum]